MGGQRFGPEGKQRDAQAKAAIKETANGKASPAELAQFLDEAYGGQTLPHEVRKKLVPPKKKVR